MTLHISEVTVRWFKVKDSSLITLASVVNRCAANWMVRIFWWRRIKKAVWILSLLCCCAVLFHFLFWRLNTEIRPQMYSSGRSLRSKSVVIVAGCLSANLIKSCVMCDSKPKPPSKCEEFNSTLNMFLMKNREELCKREPGCDFRGKGITGACYPKYKFAKFSSAKHSPSLTKNLPPQSSQSTSRNRDDVENQIAVLMKQFTTSVADRIVNSLQVIFFIFTLTTT